MVIGALAQAAANRRLLKHSVSKRNRRRIPLDDPS
jgi:hypothetical protein